MKSQRASWVSVVGAIILHFFLIWLIISCVGCKRIQRRRQERAPMRMPAGPPCENGTCDPSKVG